MSDQHLHVDCRPLTDAAVALRTDPEIVARLLLRGRLAAAALLPRSQDALVALRREAADLARVPAEVLPAAEDEAVAALLARAEFGGGGE